MKTTDWNFDFASLPHWDNRETWMAYDRFYEIPQQNALCCIYSIVEVCMGDYRGFLALFKGKENPSLLVNIIEGMNFCDNFSVSDDGRFIFLQPSLYDEQSGLQRPILVIDLVEKRFSYVLTNNTNPCYTVKQKSTDVFVVEAQESQRGDQRLMEIHGMEIHITALQWHDLNKLASLRKLIFPEKQENAAPKKGIWYYLSVVLDIAMVLFALFNISFGNATFIDYLTILGQIFIVFPVFLAVHKHKR